MRKIFIAVLLMSTTLMAGAQNQANWKNLFNGKNLDGWKVLNGTAEYSVEEGVIVGTSKIGSKNTFLTTTKMYGDFILEYEVKMDVELNSGVQIRSNTNPEYRNGVVHGYQVECEDSSRKYAGGIYDEQRRGWICPLKYNKPGREAFKKGEWNKFRVEAIGNTIRTWVNGIPTANLVDDMTASGFIGLQVHSLNKGKEHLAGCQIRWKNIRIATENLEGFRKEMPVTVHEYNLLKKKGKNKSWEVLFNGKNLKGWKILGGTAEYKVEDGEITGISKNDSPNTFLTTKDMYADFILEYEMKMDIGLNSGVQIRSNSFKDYRNGVVHGYQVECDDSNRKWAGGIYEEQGRGWLYPLEYNKPAKEAFNKGKWNKYRVEAIGNKIRIWVNGVPATNMIDDASASGFIGLQVHSLHGDAKKLAGQKIRWRNIRIATENLEELRAEMPASVREVSYLKNELTAKEKAEGWNLLFDGKTSNGWRGVKLDQFPSKGWQINDGLLIVEKSEGGESRNGGDIVTTKKYKNFILEVDFKLTKGANSGIKYFVQGNINKGEGSAIGCEFQLLDDKRHPDGKKGKNRNRSLASLYDLIPADARMFDTNLKRRRTNGITGWNRARIEVRGNKVCHFLNGIKVVEYERNTQQWDALVNYSKYENWPNFGNFEEGYILLQDHGDEVRFQNIKIKELQ